MTSLHNDFTAKLLAAKAGDPTELASLGVTYFAQRSMPTDMQTAAGLLRAAANQGDADAQNSLGAFYFLGVAKNPAEATTWLRKAADQGYPQAKEMLANVGAGRAPTAGRGCVVLLFMPLTAIGVGWLAYRLIISS